jgi:hypothetical protein
MVHDHDQFNEEQLNQVALDAQCLRTMTKTIMWLFFGDCVSGSEFKGNNILSNCSFQVLSVEKNRENVYSKGCLIGID